MTQTTGAVIKQGLFASAFIAILLSAGLCVVWGNSPAGWLLFGLPWCVGTVGGILVTRAGPPDSPKEPSLSVGSGIALGGIGLSLAAAITSDRVMSGVAAIGLTIVVGAFVALLGRYIQLNRDAP